ncbi:MAG: hypothetical protein AAF943_11500 [Pseudomonadota bacterium]
MSNEIQLCMAAMFRDATFQDVVKELQTPSDWKRLNEICETAQKAEDAEIQDYQRTKSDRIAKALENLIDKAGSASLEHPTPFGMDRFNRASNERRAAQLVENEHQAALIGILENQTAQFDELKADIFAREHRRDHARDAFFRATDRRTGEDRRMTGPSR